jgi:hypothetical protein
MKRIKPPPVGPLTKNLCADLIDVLDLITESLQTAEFYPFYTQVEIDELEALRPQLTKHYERVDLLITKAAHRAKAREEALAVEGTVIPLRPKEDA